MLAKLKNQFIAINMACIGVILFTVFLIIGISNYNRIEKISTSTLNAAFMHDKMGNLPPKEIGSPSRDEDGFMKNFLTFSVSLDENNNVDNLFAPNIEIADETLDEIIALCLTQNQTIGVIKDSSLNLSLKYMVKTNHKGTEIAFYDLSDDYNSMFHLIRSFIITGILSMSAFYLLSRLLANWILKPVENSWESQRQFIADASHELKTPLTVILANADILSSHPQDSIASKSKWLEYIKAEAEHMKKLVNDLLFLAKSDDDRENNILIEVNASDVLWNSYLPFESIAFEQGIHLDSKITPDLYIKGDTGKLKQLMMILLDNAFKYTTKDGYVTVSMHNHQDYMIFSVNNTGSPIPPEHLQHLFERFYRAEESRARQSGGYGLGLSIAKTITDIHKGKISVTSTKKDGTTFTVSIPLFK